MERRTALFVYLTAGYPDLVTTRELIPALVEAGADAVEIGIPFSDPLADGATIQESTFHALKQGVNVQDCLDIVKVLRDKIPNTPLILMGYYNPLFNYGLERFCREASSSGLDGLIVPDLPADESQPLLNHCQIAGIDLVPLLPPNSSDKRIKFVCSKAKGFIYCVTVTGITGTRDFLPEDLGVFIKRVRAHTNLPLGLGFGISTREHMKKIGQIADAGIVGSALVKILQSYSKIERKQKAIEFVKELRGSANDLCEEEY